jgi:hypothetical protein
MELKKLINIVVKKLEKEISKDPTLEKIVHVESREALVSVLRDRVFHNDKKVEDFIQNIELSEPKITKLNKFELTEAQLTELLFKSLEKTFKEKSSKLKLTNHYFSTEKDLVITLSDENNLESVYRILTVKTS